MHPGALLEVAEQRYETSVKEVVRWGDCILVLHTTACSNCHSTGQAAPRFPSTNHLTQPSPQAGCSSACSPGFVLVGIHFHLVSYTEEPEIRKMLFQIGKETNKHKKQLQNHRYSYSFTDTKFLPSCGKTKANTCSSQTELVQLEPFWA